MKLGNLLEYLLQNTHIVSDVIEELGESADIEVEKPEDLQSIEIHHIVGDAVTNACLSQIPVRGAYAFGEFVAELLTGWSTRFSNEHDVMYLSDVFSENSFGNKSTTIRIYLLPQWEMLESIKHKVRNGLVAALDAASKMQDW